MILLRSILFNVLFFLNLGVLLLVAFVAMLLPHRAVLGIAKLWGRTSMWLLRVVCGVKVEFRGVEKLTSEPLIVASKHQSTWETFALLWMFSDFTFIVKRELMWIPIFGWCMWRARMIPVDRAAGSQALIDMTARARREIGTGRQLIIFPEGTRRAVGAAAALQVRRRAALFGDRRAVRADRAELGAVLAAALVPEAAGHDRGRGARSDPARPRQDRVLRQAAGRDRNRDRAA